MKISKIVEKPLSEVARIKKFNFTKKVKRQRFVLMPLIWLLALPETFKRKFKVTKHNMEEVEKEPYILLCNHNSFYDFKMATRSIYPRRATYIVAIDGFINREWLMREVGCFGKRKFINDLYLIKQIKRSVNDLKHICMIYPEARYSHVGTNAILPDSLGKLLKHLKTPVVSLISHGNHLAQPVWNLKTRKVNTTADMTYLFSKDDLINLSVEEINKKINQAFEYDDYKWQKDNNIEIKEHFRAEGIEAVLYKCPNCKTEGSMNSKGSHLTCDSCGKVWQMNELGSLEAKIGKTEFSHIPDWYEWQREEVRKEIENKTYHFEHDVEINSLPSSKGFYQIGKGKLIHNLDGFVITGSGMNEDFTFLKTPIENYSVHVEYNYFGRGHGISFSYLNDTYYMFSKDKSYLVTKVHFAVEELYKIVSANSKQIKKAE